MYAMIYACNLTLEHLATIPLSADKANTIAAWVYWWKGYAYAQLGTLYYAGLIIDQPNTVVSNYVDHAALIDESNKYLNQAIATLSSISNQADYSEVIARLIPMQNQAGLGMPLSSTQWIKTINTYVSKKHFIESPGTVCEKQSKCYY
jgi:hypothetical protein